ncbi:MAG: S-methyl-5'-thioadenosine phosphorylase [Elusimicrobia bacterium]|nr:S-methyl-5'-thioadenosine phosphorylase [Elusimicrobiota bacterium]
MTKTATLRRKSSAAPTRANGRQPVRFAVIGGSGLYEMKSITDVSEVRVKTPFGDPSDAIILGTIRGVRCAFLPRHGRGHKILPGEINGRANIWALKSLGVERIISVGAVGSLREELAPRHFVFPDQLADETKGRRSTFFGEGIVGHVAFAHPFCGAMSRSLFETARGQGVTAHEGGTYICMEGPAFSSRAESLMHRQLGYSIIGMTAIPEAKLAREAEICYAPMALVTDYDCWKEGEEVSIEQVVANLSANVANAQRVIEEALPKLAGLSRSCQCASAMATAVFTRPEAMNKATYKKLELLIGKYVPA